jgi:hypothetical protein
MNRAQLEKNYKILINELNDLCSILKVKKRKIPKNIDIDKMEDVINKISKDLLVVKPTSFLLKTIEIKSYYERPTIELDKCFPGGFYLADDLHFKSMFFEYAVDNLKNYENNELTSNGIKTLINKIPSSSLLKKYIGLIEDITKVMNEEEATLCNVLVTTPYKYRDLTAFINHCINSSILPENPATFYSLNKINENKKNFQNFLSKKNELQDMKNDYNAKIENLTNYFKKLMQEEREYFEEKIKSLQEKSESLQKKIESLREKVDESNMLLFRIHTRDVIKIFQEKIAWVFQIRDYDTTSFLPNLNERLEEFTQDVGEQEKQGKNMILDTINKLKEFKNIGFKEDLLPSEIRTNYLKYKKKENCNVYGYDCVALILCLKDVNNSDDEDVTKKKYEYFQSILNISIKDWESKKEFLKKKVLDY